MLGESGEDAPRAERGGLDQGAIDVTGRGRERHADEPAQGQALRLAP